MKDFDAISKRVGAEAADLLAGDRATARMFLDTVAAGIEAELVAKWMINELPRALGDKELEESNLDAARFAALLKRIAGGMSATVAKAVLAEMVETGKGPDETEAARKGETSVDLGSVVEGVIAANPEKAAQYKAGKTGLLGFFVGQVMKSAPGANPTEVNEAVRARLQ
jgi:Asp-tRNA(Asn)/Glu-tRNA(Gln) amidotransferase B subunit